MFCIEKPAYHMFKNDVDWTPSLHLGHDKLGPGRSESHQERHRRVEARKREEMEQERLDALFADDLNVQELYDGLWDKETQTVHTGKLVADFFNEVELIKDNQKVKYYTGLPNGELLMEVF